MLIIDANRNTAGESHLQQAEMLWNKIGTDTDHCFYLLDGQVIDYCTAPVLKERVIRQQGGYGHFCCDTYVTQRQRGVRSCPFRYVQKPF